MSVKNGAMISTVLLVGCVLAGSGAVGSGSVTEDQWQSSNDVANVGSVCASENSVCSGRETALLNAPNIVVYQTRADLTKSVPAETEQDHNGDAAPNELVNVPEKPDRQN